MIKKILISLGILVLLMAAIICWFLYRPVLAIDKVLPSGALFYFRLAHAQKHWKEFSSSEFFKNIAAINENRVLEHNGFSDDKIKEIQRRQSQLQLLVDNPVLQKIWGKEVAVAVYPGIGSHSKKEDNVLIVARLDLSMQAAEIAGQLLTELSKDNDVRQEPYKGINITHVNLRKEKITVSYLLIKDLLVATVEPSSVLENVVDVYQSKIGSLSSDSQFALVHQYAYPGSDGEFFVNVANFVHSSRSKHWASIFPAYGITYLPASINHFKVVMSVNSEEMKPEMRQAFDCEGTRNDSLKFIPANAILYNWGSCYDFPSYWQQATEQLQHKASLMAGAEKFKHSLEKRLHLNIEHDILPVLGQEVGGYLTDIDTQGMFPFPRMLIFVKIKDRAAIQDALNKITKHPLATIQSEDYEGVNLHYMPLPFGSNLDPGYAFIDDYLLIATSQQLLRKSIDVTKDSGRSLGSDKNFKVMGLSDGDKIKSVSFLKIGDMSSRLVDLLGWGNRYLASQINLAEGYKQDREDKKKDLIGSVQENSSDLKLAENKLKDLKIKASSVPAGTDAAVDPSITEGAINNLQREVERMKTDIQTDTAQMTQIDNELANYDIQADEANLMIFNSENVLIPFLNAIGTLDLEGVKVKTSLKAVETELLLK